MKSIDIFYNVIDHKRLRRANSGRGLCAPHIPYQGNKAGIANQIINAVPKCDNFLDACCGGGVIGYSMEAYGKAQKITMNDIYKPIIDLHEALQNGSHGIDWENIEFCTREQFKLSLNKIESGKYKPIDVVNAVCYSFGNDMSSYAYSKDIEKYKQTMHELIFERDIKKRRLLIRALLQSLQRLQGLQSLQSESLQSERLQSLQSESLQSESLQSESLQSSVNFTSQDIFEIDYTPFDCVYFDPPYKNTSGYNANKSTVALEQARGYASRHFKLAAQYRRDGMKNSEAMQSAHDEMREEREFEGGFPHAKFWELFMDLPMLAFASEYQAPDFVPLYKEFNKRVLMQNNKNNATQKGKEKLYCNKIEWINESGV